MSLFTIGDHTAHVRVVLSVARECECCGAMTKREYITIHEADTLVRTRSDRIELPYMPREITYKVEHDIEDYDAAIVIDDALFPLDGHMPLTRRLAAKDTLTIRSEEAYRVDFGGAR